MTAPKRRAAAGPVFRDAAHLSAVMARIDTERATRRRRRLGRVVRVAGVTVLALVLLACEDPKDTPGGDSGWFLTSLLLAVVAVTATIAAGIVAIDRARAGGTR